jgi:hypothetical protein
MNPAPTPLVMLNVAEMARVMASGRGARPRACSIVG